MRFLTRAYVQALRLPIVPLRTRRGGQVRYRPPDAPLPHPSNHGFIMPGVRHNGQDYIQEPDGLAYAHVDQPSLLARTIDDELADDRRRRQHGR